MLTDGHPPPNPPLKVCWLKDADRDAGIRWLVDDIIPEQGIGFLAGASGSGKTFLAVHMAFSASLGRTFFGRKLSRSVGVLYVAGEGGSSIDSRMLAAGEHAFGLSLEHAKRQPVAILKSCPNLLSATNLRNFIGEGSVIDAQMRAVYGVGLEIVIFDTFSQCFQVGSENEAAHVTGATKAMQEIADALGVAVMATHHMGKGKSTGMRGSSAFRANVDFVLEVRDGGELYLEKCRNGVEEPLGYFRLAIVARGTKPDGSPATTCRVEITDKPKRSERPEKRPKAPKISKGEKTFHDSFTAMASGGRALEGSMRKFFLEEYGGTGNAGTRAWTRARDKSSRWNYRLCDGQIERACD